MIIAGEQIFKMAASGFVDVSEEEINLMKENAIPRSTKHATRFGMTLFKGKMCVKIVLNVTKKPFKFPWMKILLITTCMNNLSFIYQTEWFQQQTEFTTEFEAMEVNEMNKCLWKFYVSVRRKDGTFYKRNSLSQTDGCPCERSCSLTRDNDKI